MFDFLTNVVEKVEVVVARVHPMTAWLCERFVLTLHTSKPLAICHALFVADLLEAIHSASLKKNKGIVFSPKVKPPSPGTLALAGSPLKVFFNMGIL